jgi:glycerophosphoryl diester phosphodiesterase
MKLHHLTWVVLAVGSAAAAGDEAPAWTVRDHVPVARFVIQSHRGAGELEAENTLPAFELAWSLGTVPEADLRMTKDGVIVAFHDANFRRLVKDAGPDLAKKGVKDVTWDDLRKLDVGAWKGEQFIGRRVPKMAEVFDAMTGRPGRRLYLDIKDMDLKKLAGEVRAARVESQVILASTHHAIIREWKALVPESGTLLWMGGTEEALEKRLADLRRAKFDGVTQLQVHVRTTEGGELTPSAAFLTKVGRELRSHDILFQTLPWGSTDPKLYWRLLDLGVASFATDHPAVTLDAVRKYYDQRK